MPIYAKKLSKEWKKAFEQYERISGFEPMHQEDIDNNEMTAKGAWDSNIRWLEDVLAATINIPTPFEDI